MRMESIQEISLACFRLGEDLYAVDIMRIREIIRPMKLAHLPKAPAFVEGVINLRSNVIPVVDLRKRFDIPSRDGIEGNKLLIMSVSRKSVGLVVDDVTEIVTVPIREIKPPPMVIKGVGAEYLIGVCLVKDVMVMLLNIDRILSPDEVDELGRVSEYSQSAKSN